MKHFYEMRMILLVMLKTFITRRHRAAFYLFDGSSFIITVFLDNEINDIEEFQTGKKKKKREEGIHGLGEVMKVQWTL